MEKINTEILVSTLFNLGFESVDPVLFTYTLGKLSLMDKERQLVFEEREPGIGFKEYVDCSGISMKIKDGYTLDTNVSPDDKMIIPVRKTLFGSRILIEYLSDFDFSEIIEEKATAYGVQSVESANPNLFCEKEIKMLQALRENQNSKQKKQQRKLLKKLNNIKD